MRHPPSTEATALGQSPTVEGHGQELPLGLYLAQTPQMKLSKAQHALENANDRFDGDGAQPIQRSARCAVLPCAHARARLGRAPLMAAGARAARWLSRSAR